MSSLTMWKNLRTRYLNRLGFQGANAIPDPSSSEEFKPGNMVKMSGVSIRNNVGMT